MQNLFLLDEPEAPGAQLQPTGRLPSSFIGELISTGMLNLKTFYADQAVAA